MSIQTASARIFTLLVLATIAIIGGADLRRGVAPANAQHEDHKPAKADSGPLSNATVSFGAWATSPPLDRFSTAPPPPAANHHVVAPYVATIKAGGAVNFIIAGLHNVAVYADGTKPEDIDTSLIAPPPPPGKPAPPVIDDPEGRIYRGPDPRVLFPTVDRVEVVHFAEPGTYLVICGVLPHFQEGMYGYVRVVP